jgi:hypothetical protein
MKIAGYFKLFQNETYEFLVVDQVEAGIEDLEDTAIPFNQFWFSHQD